MRGRGSLVLAKSIKCLGSKLLVFQRWPWYSEKKEREWAAEREKGEQRERGDEREEYKKESVRMGVRQVCGLKKVSIPDNSESVSAY